MIFLTGMPRCGSTWSAKALAHLTGSRYVHEPLNGHRHPELAAYNMRYFRRGACDRRMLSVLRKAVRKGESSAWWSGIMRRTGSEPVVLKEVHATLAIECVDRYLKPGVVIITRHPCGVAASWKGLGWLAAPWAEGDPLLDQEELATDHLHPFATHILSTRDPFFRIGAYWGSIYYVLRRLAASHPEWLWITHEDLCIAPRELFTELLQVLRKPIDAGAADFLARHDRPRAGEEGPYDTYRETRSEPDKWRTLLSAHEIELVLAGAQPFGMDELLRTRVGRLRS